MKYGCIWKNTIWLYFKRTNSVSHVTHKRILNPHKYIHTRAKEDILDWPSQNIWMYRGKGYIKRTPNIFRRIDRGIKILGQPSQNSWATATMFATFSLDGYNFIWGISWVTPHLQILPIIMMIIIMSIITTWLLAGDHTQHHHHDNEYNGDDAEYDNLRILIIIVMIIIIATWLLAGVACQVHSRGPAPTVP